MSIARYLSKLGALLNSSGQVPAAGLAAGAAASNLGFTPMVTTDYNSTSVDLNAIVTAGCYRLGATGIISNLPTGANGYGNLLVLRTGTQDTITQIYSDYSNGALYTRSGNPSNVGGSGAWSAWQFSNSIGTSGQVWTDVTGSRAGGTTYTNSTGKPIVVNWFNSNLPSNGTSTVYINGGAIGGFNNYGSNGGGMIIVPNGATYSISYSGSSLSRWWELR